MLRWKETLYKRRLRRPFGAPVREAITTAFAERRHEIPVPAELHWSASEPAFTIRSTWMSFVVRFTAEEFVVDAELSLAAKALATKENRETAVRFIESLADDLGL